MREFLYGLLVFITSHADQAWAFLLGAACAFFLVLAWSLLCGLRDRRQREAIRRRRAPRPPAVEWHGDGRHVHATRSDDRLIFSRANDAIGVVQALGPHQRRALRAKGG